MFTRLMHCLGNFRVSAKWVVSHSETEQQLTRKSWPDSCIKLISSPLGRCWQMERSTESTSKRTDTYRRSSLTLDTTGKFTQLIDGRCNRTPSIKYIISLN